MWLYVNELFLFETVFSVLNLVCAKLLVIVNVFLSILWCLFLCSKWIHVLYMFVCLDVSKDEGEMVDDGKTKF